MRLLFTAILFSFYSVAHASCIYCTDLDDALEKPSEVQHLDLSGQGLTKLPDSLHKFVNLVSLDLSDNEITDLEFGKGEWTELESLSLNYNPGLNFYEVSKIAVVMPNLKELRIRRCSLIALPPVIGGLKELEFLDVSYNHLQSLPDELQNCNLKELRVRNNALNNSLWALGLWKIKSLDASGNEALKLDALGHALLFKELDELTISPDDQGNQLTTVYKNVAVEKLIVRGQSTAGIAKSIATNKQLKTLVFEGVSIQNGESFYSWLNLFETIEKFEFQNMELPKGFHDIKTPQTIFLDLCRLEDPRDLENMNSSIQVKTVNMMKAEMGNSTLSRVEEMPTPIDVTESMVNNEVAAIVAFEPVEKTINAQKSEVVVLENTAYNIPENAFLTKSGEVYTGEVNLEITEYNDALTNALTGAPMVFRDGGSNQIFSSSGMLEFNAFGSDGEELQPNPENIIQVEILDLQPAEDTRLYSFDENENNWIDIGTPISTDYGALRQKILDSLNQIPDDYFFTVNSATPDFVMEYKRKSKDPWEINFEEGRKGFISDRRLETIFKRSGMEQEWLARGNKTLLVDTVMTEELQALIRDIGTRSKRGKKFGKRKKKELLSSPVSSTLTMMTLTPNFEADNYTLTFNYQGEPVSLPVVFEEKGSIRRIQNKEESRYKDLVHAQKMAKNGDSKLDARKEKLIQLAAQKARKSRAEYLSSPQYLAMQQSRLMQGDAMLSKNKETLSFGLSSFGLVNCDYFSRNAVDGYIKSTDFTYDEQGDRVKVPNDIRNVIAADNVYLSTSKEKIPQFRRKRTFLFFLISATKIAVITGWEKIKGKGARPIIKTVSTEGMTPAQIRSEILSL
jgi:hypothetical protein